MADIAQPKFLIGEDIYLRPIHPNDAERCYVWMNDPNVTRWLNASTAIPFPAEVAWVERVTKERPTTDHVFAIVRRDGDIHIGNIGLHEIDWVSRTGTTGIIIGDRTFWRHAHGFTAAILLLHYAFTGLNLRKIHSSVLAPNTGSVRIHVKCGFRQIGTLRAHHFREGQYHDALLWELFTEDFAPVWERHHTEIAPTP